MTKNEILKELEAINGILDKFKEELEDCNHDRDTLDRLRAQDGQDPNFIRAERAVIERREDILLSMNLLLRRKEELLLAL